MKNKRGTKAVTPLLSVTDIRQKRKEVFVESRAKYRCPEKLAELLEVINSVPPEVPFFNLDYLEYKMDRDRKKLEDHIRKNVRLIPVKFLN